MSAIENLPEMVGDYTGPEAQALATMHLVREQRTTNRLLVALIDQLTEVAPYLIPAPPFQAQSDPQIRIRDYLTDEEWTRLEVDHA